MATQSIAPVDTVGVDTTSKLCTRIWDWYTPCVRPHPTMRQASK